MSNKYKVTDKNGKVHKRTSRDRVYTHAVVRHWEAYSYALGWKPANAERAAEMLGRGHEGFYYDPVAGDIFREVLAGSDASWCGRLDLAHKQAGADRKLAHVTDVEIIPV
jgi:hypothetical protein